MMVAEFLAVYCEIGAASVCDLQAVDIDAAVLDAAQRFLSLSSPVGPRLVRH